MRIIWTQAAAKERAQIWDHLYTLNPRAAAEMDKRFSDAVSRLSHNPKTGQFGIIAGTRELIPHPSYRLVYQIEQDAVWILTLIHTARMWPQPDSN
ncbi:MULTISPECIES: type II toxin-antitoxin system RelE/ParE family toxin [Pseudomonas]|uniref:Type II toxin-antitoxin system RelE/ParE family toxin n=1 Tax=Pseudomonas koreensis TaxID=198620 RepID=A0A9X3B556_9PSED|nr:MULTISPECIES: type II toxin-antitoxin system RelE/ParE family toxin [Pseudomonas]MBV4476627.1 type II toxin-antitoxin system RelE/ParE family toxin [Pseudomonas botevensis]MCU7251102.1 type II toxin-antitoxin system RelE/ParE family toxin [Pseudomonas koreensis]